MRSAEAFAAIAIAACAIAQNRPAFEVASVKPVKRDVAPQNGPIRSTGFSESIDPALVRYTNVTLKFLLMRAYNLKPYQVGGVSRLDSTHYDVIAKLPNGALKQQIPTMLQSLLTERFKMKLHWKETKEPAYALVAGRNGPRLKASTEAGAKRLSFSPDGHLEFVGTTLEAFADTLANFMAYPVLDLTGIQGRFDINLAVSMEDLRGLRPRIPEQAESGDDTASIFTAIQALGLKLEPRRIAMKRLVVDEAAKIPTEN